MKKYVLLLALVLPLPVIAQDFNIQGNISSRNSPVAAYLSYQIGGMFQTDSSVVQNGRFSFKGGLNGEPLLANIKIRYKDEKIGNVLNDQLTLYLDSGKIQITSSDSLNSALVKGSKTESENRELNAALALYLVPFGKINNEVLDALHKDPAVSKQAWFKNKLESAKPYIIGAKATKKKFIDSHHDSYIALMTFLADWNGSEISNLDSIKTDFSKFSSRIRSTSLGEQAGDLIKKAISRQPGAIIADFTQTDIDGKTFAFSSLKGKYVLVDFWASWCAPCRAENPNVLKAYKALHDKGLEVVGVSLDMDKNSWKQAVIQDGMPWLQLSDLKGFDCILAQRFGIRAIPQNIFIGPNGRVLANNIRGEDTDKKLEKLMSVKLK